MKFVQTGIIALALSLFVISCGDANTAEEAAEATTEAVENAAEETTEAVDAAAETVDSMATEATQMAEDHGHDHAEGEGH